MSKTLDELEAEIKAELAKLRHDLDHHFHSVDQQITFGSHDKGDQAPPEGGA